MQVPEQPRQGLGDKTVWFLSSQFVLSCRTERWQQPHAAISDALFMVLGAQGQDKEGTAGVPIHLRGCGEVPGW